MPLRIAILVIGETVASIATLVKPWWGILALLFLIFARPQDDRPNMADLHIPLALTAAALLATAARLPALRFRVGRALKRTAVMIAYFLIMVLSAATHGMTAESSDRLEQFAPGLAMFFLLLVWTRSATELRWVIATMIAAGLWLVKLAIYNPSFIKSYAGETAGIAYDRLNLQKVNVNFGNPNYLALFMVLLILLTLFALLYYRRVLVRLLMLVLTGAWFWVFFRALSRAATLALVASLLVFWLFQRRKLLLGWVMAVTLLVGIASAPAVYFDRLRLIANYEEDASATGRIGYWETGLRLTLANPLLGVGPDNFIYYADNTPHNAYLQVASELGLPALGLYLAMLFGGFRSAWVARNICARQRKNLPMLHALSGALFAGCLAIALQGFFTGLAHREFVFIFLGLCHCARYSAESIEPAPARVAASARLRLRPAAAQAG